MLAETGIVVTDLKITSKSNKRQLESHNSTCSSSQEQNIKRTCASYPADATKPSILSKEGRISQLILTGARVMVLMRGLPGSGKTFLAKLLVKNGFLQDDKYEAEDFIYSSDDFFYDALGYYKWSLDRLDDAHSFNRERVKLKTLSGWSPIIIDNTNMKLWEMLPYVESAVNNGYIVEILEPKTPWCYSADILAKKNHHGVTRSKIQKMFNKYEAGTIDDLFKMLNGKQYTVSIPQMRLYPPLQSEKEKINDQDKLQIVEFPNSSDTAEEKKELNQEDKLQIVELPKSCDTSEEKEELNDQEKLQTVELPNSCDTSEEEEELNQKDKLQIVE